MTTKKILLFDMDGVLLTAHGYHRAARDTVARLGQALGFEGVSLSADDILAFEACGITNEWDTVAICLAALTDQVWTQFPEIAISPELIAAPIKSHSLAGPDFQALLQAMAAPDLQAIHPLARAKTYLPEKIHFILDNAYQDDSLSMRIQQEHVLGSVAFEDSYGLAPLLDVPSYLITYDESNLTPAVRADLFDWLKAPQHHATIFTNRPSTAPEGVFCTPEAEPGAKLVGVEEIPLAATGGIVWLEAKLGQPPSTFNKPHPIHALAALRRSLGDSIEAAFSLAAELALDGKLAPAWSEVAGADVWVFEDSTGGLRSLLSAQEILGEQGIPINTHLVGVAENQSKKDSLSKAGAQVFESLGSSLEEIFN